MRVTLRFLSGAFFFLIILAGCTIKETVKNTSDQEILKERGTAYWGHMCKQEFDKAYEFEYPLYKKTVSLVDYIRRFRRNVKWENAAVEDITVDDGAAMMKVKVKTEINLMVPKSPRGIKANPTVVLNEKWIKVDGVWYHVPQKNIRREN
jgi:hypothetical protein